MATVLAVLCSGRKSGYTAGLLQAAAESAAKIDDVEVDLVRLHDYQFKPCTSCFACIRDEAHRFAITAHRKQRAKKGLASRLDAVPGIGPARRKALLTTFGSIDKIEKASVEELSQVNGINADLAHMIKSHLE